jgi:hypothetical protein
VVNGLLILFQQLPDRFVKSFLTSLGTPVDPESEVLVRDHVPYAPESIVDGELHVPGAMLVAIEAKIQRGQFVDTDQPARYVELLARKKCPQRVLLLLSPDACAPRIVSTTPRQDDSCFVVWRSWEEVFHLVERARVEHGTECTKSRFLTEQYLDYLRHLGLNGDVAAALGGDPAAAPRLHFLFGNVAAEKILLHLYHHSGGHVRGIARDHGMGMGATQRVLKRFVNAGILQKQSRGRIVWYSFNHKGPLIRPILELIRHVYEAIPLETRRRMFAPKHKPGRPWGSAANGGPTYGPT